MMYWVLLQETAEAMEGVGVSCIHPGQPGCCLLALCTDTDCRDADSQLRDIR